MLLKKHQSVSLSHCRDEAESLYVVFSVWYIHLCPPKLNLTRLRTGGRKKAFPGHLVLLIHSYPYTTQYFIHITNR